MKLSWLDKYKMWQNITTSERYVLRKMAKIWKVILHFMTTFHNFALKQKPVELKIWLSSFWKLGISKYVYIYA